MARAIKLMATASILIAVAGIRLAWPQRVDESRFTGLQGDREAGALVFWAGGCASCHAMPGGGNPLLLAGGTRLQSDFGTFISPNISSDVTHGISGWTLTEFASAMLQGTSPEGRHYYPAFPFTSYAKMTDEDVANLWAFLQTLPASETPNAEHELSFPYSLRMAIGGWKFLYASNDWVRPADTTKLARGRYLVEALGHCAECHTPRDEFGGLDKGRWMAGAPNPSGRGRIPGITPAQLNWSGADIEYYLETGFTPDFDSAGGGMASVVRNLSNLPASDRAAIAAYIKDLPPTE